MVACRVVVILAGLPYLALGTQFWWLAEIEEGFLLPIRLARWERTSCRWSSRWWCPPPPTPSLSRWSSSAPPSSYPPAPPSPSWPPQSARCCQTWQIGRNAFSRIFQTRFASLEPHAGQCWLSFPTHPARQEVFWGSRELQKCLCRPGLVLGKAPQAQPARSINHLLGAITDMPGALTNLPGPITNGDADVVDAWVW